MDNDHDIIEEVFESLSTHGRLLDRAVTQLRDDARIAGLLLGGSLADESISVDRYSDIDLYVIARGEDFSSILDDRRAIAESVGTPLFQYVPDHLPNGDRQYGVLYEELVKCDFMYRRLSALSPDWQWKQCRVLADTGDNLAELVAESQQCSPAEPSAKRLETLNQKFWTWCWDIYGFIRRGELWTAVASIHSLRSTFLLPLLAWTTETPDHGCRRLESKLTENRAERFESTLPGRDPDALYSALKSSVVLYTDLREEVFSRYGVTYDTEPESKVCEEIRQRWKT